MKSAYELAMERLERESGPSQTLTDKQREHIAEIDKKYEARMAEARLAADGRLAGAASMEEVNGIRSDLASDLQSLEEKREREKEAVWTQE